MKRTEFLKILGAGTLTALAGSLMPSCKSSTTTPEPVTPESKTFDTRPADDGHFHTVTLTKTEIKTPPTGGISRETSSTNGHTHTFTMTSAQLTQVNSGNTVDVQTADTLAHHHTFAVTMWWW
jgi:hypothetical protein